MKATVLCTLVFFVVLATAAIPPPYLPTEWTSRWQFVRTNGTVMNAGGGWYYDYHSQNLRQDNAYSCDGQGENGCSGIFLKSNFYLNSASQNICCLCFTDLPMTPPDWFVNNGAKYTGLSEILNTTCYRYAYNDTDGGEEHALYIHRETGHPFAEEGGGVVTNWWDVKTGPVNPDVFKLIDSACDTKKCPSSYGCESALAASVSSSDAAHVMDFINARNDIVLKK